MNSTRIVFAALLTQLVTTYAYSADFPTRPVRIIVAQAAGSGVDIMARTLAAKLTESLGQQVIVDNRPGANGIIGMEAAAKSKPDGHTLVLGVPSALTMNPYVYKTLPYDTFRDFAPITQTAVNTFVLVVNPVLPVRSVNDLVMLGKRRPGELIYGSFGVGNQTHLAAELFRSEGQLKVLHVPYKGGTPAVSELLGGQTTFMFSPSQGVAPYIKSGRLRLLATCGESRAKAFPDAPTMIEAGLKRVVVTGWTGLLAPAGTPVAIIERLAQDTAQHLAIPELRQQLSAAGAEPVGSTPKAFAAFIKAEAEKWGRVVREAGLAQSQ
jgi:tripartite-type tricarboxylate transporter receptor subunit TctC